MFRAVSSPYLVPDDGSFRVAEAPTSRPESAPSKARRIERLAERLEDLKQLQRKLYAQDRWAVLLIFQAMDAAGKDGTIRSVLSGVNPAGCQVFSFKRPSHEELDHDFLWRTARRLPERGRIGIFNRSYYEEVLVVRVHPELLSSQRLPFAADRDRLWQQRFDSIRSHEEHLARNGVVVLKFWLNVSREEQRQRFLARIEEPEKNWKFAAADVEERRFWENYMKAYEEALNATSRPWAPWYAIPADSKSYMRMQVAEILVASLASLGLHYPSLGEKELQGLEAMRRLLEEDR